MIRLTFLLVIVLGWLQYSLWLRKNGVIDFVRATKVVATQQAYNAKLKARNKLLFAEIDDLNSGYQAVEERARKELGMIKPDEIFYRLVPQQNQILLSLPKQHRE